MEIVLIGINTHRIKNYIKRCSKIKFCDKRDTLTKAIVRDDGINYFLYCEKTCKLQ